MAALPESPTRWSEARRLFHAVVDLDPAEREPVLARYDGGAGVVAEVRSLLEWHLRDPAFLDRERPSPPEMADTASCTTLGTDPEIRGPQRTE
jgi:hypothetical protein